LPFSERPSLIAMPLIRRAHGKGQCDCHISAIRRWKTAGLMREQRGQRRIVNDQLSARLDRWLPEPIRALERMMTSLRPEKAMQTNNPIRDRQM
jgi:hypothetical protein